MSNLRSLPLGVLAGALFCSAALLAQSSSVAPRITSAVQESSLTTLTGNVPLLAKAQNDSGQADASTQLTHMRLVLARSDQQQAALDNYLAQLQDKSSANYHKWLTPAQFGALYGPADSDIAAMVAWLQSHGLKLEAVSAGRTNISFSGTVSQVEEAFHTPIHSFTASGQQFYSNTSNPQIPSALATVVKGVAHLSTFKPKPLGIRGRLGALDPDTHLLAPVSSASSLSSVRSLETITSTSGNYYLYMVPGDAATIYNTPNTTLNANYSSGTTWTGTGVTIGIGGDAAISTTPVVNYRSLFLGETSPIAPTITNVDGVTSTTDADEAYLDIEISGGLAPGAAIHYYPSSDLFSGIEQALNENSVDIFSLSFGACELGYTTADNAQVAAWWKQAAVQGIAVTVSSGDNGSAACDDPSSATKAEYGLQVNALGSTAYNISVGGTDFALTQSNFSTYAATSGSSTNHYRTAKARIPETTWNDSTSSNTTISANVPYSGTTANIYAGSGGKSNCSTNTNTATTLGSCTAGWSKPSWQRGTGVPSDSVRDLPDISLMSGDGAHYAAWLVCTNDTSNGTTANCSGSNFAFYGFGGTSTASPAFAGILALVQQSQGGGRLGQAAANLYNIYNNSSSASSVFHDVTTGNISVPCDSASTYSGCSKNTAGNYFLTGYDTTTGYDLATGLGSVDVAKLIANWSSGLGSTAATVTVTPAASAITTANSLNVTVAVTGSSSTPTGSIVLSGGGYTSAAVDLNSGSASFTIAAGALAAGADTLTATYSGDATYSSATNSAIVTVTAAALTATTTTLTASATSATYETSVTLTATVSPTAASGTVTFFNGSTRIGAANLTSGVATFATATAITTTATPLPIGSDSITALYAGNTTYASSTSSAVTVSVTGTTSGSTSAGVTGTTTVAVTPSGGYTGTVIYSLFTNSTYLLNYSCYDLANATVSGTSAVNQTLTIYLFASQTNCSSNAVHGSALHAFRQLKAAKVSSNPVPSITRAAFTSLGLLFAGLLGWRFRKARAYFCLLALMTLGFAISGCGGGSSSSSSSGSSGGKSFAVTLSPTTVSVTAGSSGVPTGSYGLTVEGDDSSNTNIYSTAALTITVK